MTDKQHIVEEQLLIKKLIKGDTNAFDLLFDRYSRKIYGFALRYLKSEVNAEGVVQDVFLYIWNSRKNIRTDTNFRSYLFTITINLIKKVFRREAYQLRFIEESSSPKVDSSVDEQLEYASLLEEVDKLIDKLPERRRNIFIKSRKLSMSSKEIARELGITAGTVDNQISEALKFLRTRIDTEMLLLLLVIFFN
jgi:RNA polymerase sigma-70 factor (ECF subfamily)